MTVGLYENGQPGEIFVTLGKAGSTLAGFADSFATAVSFALQHGVELRFLAEKFSHVRFEPSGYTGNEDIPFAKSIVDYVFRWMALTFLQESEQEASVALFPETAGQAQTEGEKLRGLNNYEGKLFITQADSPPCTECGSLMIRNGSCYACINCGTTSGCS